MDDALIYLRGGPVIAVEGSCRQVMKKLRAVVGKRLAKAVEDRNWQATRIRLGLDHDRRNRADQNRPCDAALRLAEPGDIARDLAAAGGMTDVDGVRQAEMFYDSRSVDGVVIHIVSSVDL
jgi:hypothetical protein